MIPYNICQVVCIPLLTNAPPTLESSLSLLREKSKPSVASMTDLNMTRRYYSWEVNIWFEKYSHLCKRQIL